jgi:hypothetical protein
LLVWYARMRVSMEVRGQLATRFAVLLPHLNERQQPSALAVEARPLGHGGVRAVAQVAGVSETTVRKGVVELEAGEAPLPPGRVRRPGGGRTSAARPDPDLLPALLALVEPDERGDPMSPLRWTTKSLRHVAEELTRQGTRSRPRRWVDGCRGKGCSLQANAKTLEGAQHPDRDARFRYRNEQVKDHQADGEPVVSVDTNKREQLGRLPMAGREGHPTGEPVEVEDHHLLLHRSGRRAGHRVRDLRPDAQYRLGRRRRRPRHRRVRGRLHPPLVAGTRKPGGPEGIAAADLCGRGRPQQLPPPGLEKRTGGAGRRDRLGDHGVPLPVTHSTLAGGNHGRGQQRRREQARSERPPPEEAEHRCNQ